MPQINVSVGELLDKWTILEIKKKKVTDNQRLLFVIQEMLELEPVVKAEMTGTNDPVGLAVLVNKLAEINKDLWEVEDNLRILESNEFWDDEELTKEFIELARKVYRFNDYRAKIKREINELTGSNIVEVKEYGYY